MTAPFTTNNSFEGQFHWYITTQITPLWPHLSNNDQIFSFRPKIRIESGSSTSSRDSSSVQTDSETQFLKEEKSENEFLPQRRTVTKEGFRIKVQPSRTSETAKFYVGKSYMKLENCHWSWGILIFQHKILQHPQFSNYQTSQLHVSQNNVERFKNLESR